MLQIAAIVCKLCVRADARSAGRRDQEHQWSEHGRAGAELPQEAAKGGVGCSCVLGLKELVHEAQAVAHLVHLHHDSELLSHMHTNYNCSLLSQMHNNDNHTRTHTFLNPSLPTASHVTQHHMSHLLTPLIQTFEENKVATINAEVQTVLRGCAGSPVRGQGGGGACARALMSAVMLGARVHASGWLTVLQVTLSLMRNEQPIGHVCIIRDFYYSAH